MKLVALLVALVPTVAVADRVYNQSAETITHDCDKDGNAVFNGAGSKVTLTGKCEKISINGSTVVARIASVAKLAINGSKNEVTIEAVDKLAVTGSDNTVTYKKGVSGKPKISSVGTGNKISQTK